MLYNVALYSLIPNKLVLHFDVNKTLIATDLVQNKDLETILNCILAEFTHATWDGVTEESYYSYVTAQIAHEHPNFSRSSELFKIERTRRIAEFPHYLKNNHPQLYQHYKEELSALLQILSKEPITIFPSFFKLIAWLNAGPYNNNYSIHLRTFGKDLPEIVPLIEQYSTLKFTAYGVFKGTQLHLYHPNAIMTYDTHYELYQLFSESNKHYAIQDDYLQWKSNNFQAEGGKPFPFDKKAATITLFFDDNANDPDKPIICPIELQEGVAHTVDLIEAGLIIVVNPKEAILNEKYFIEKVQSALVSHASVTQEDTAR